MGKEDGYTVNSCILALEGIRFVGTKTYIQMPRDLFTLQKQKGLYGQP